AMFDLVILDEAAHIDQIRAAPVLARAARALVVGDPRQLRFVSFVADVDVAATLAAHELAEYGDRLDVRRTSAFDLAVGAAPVTYLAEHHRSAPHLIEFSAKRFYGDRIALMTRHPRNERTDAIDVVRVPAGTAGDTVHRAEVDAVVAAVRELAARAVTGIGVITPFRDQADALESALLAAFPVEEVERLGLRTGTVHAFQGSEADTVLVSLGLADADPPARQRFVADANLFNVMVTRARIRILVVTSLTGGNGIVADYLAYSETPPPPIATTPTAPPTATAGARAATTGPDWAAGPDTVTTGPRAATAGRDGLNPGRGGPDRGPDGWTARLGAQLAAVGFAVRAGYPVGRWTVDLCVGEGDRAVGLVCRVHPDGI